MAPIRWREALAARRLARRRTGPIAVIRLPRTIRLDRSDAVIFAPAAEPGNGRCRAPSCLRAARSGQLDRKEQIAFRSGFLGVDSFGWSTLVTVTLARPEERDEAVEALARQLGRRSWARRILHAARPAAEEEMALAEDLCRGHAEGHADRAAPHRRTTAAYANGSAR